MTHPVYVRYYAQTISKGFAKMRKSAPFEIFAILFSRNGLMKQNFKQLRTDSDRDKNVQKLEVKNVEYID